MRGNITSSVYPIALFKKRCTVLQWVKPNLDYVVFIIFLETALHLMKHKNINKSSRLLFSTTEHIFTQQSAGSNALAPISKVL